MKLFLTSFTIVFLLSLYAFAENSQILKCRVSNPEWTSSFVLDAVGNGFLKFKKAGDKNYNTCQLNVEYFNNNQRAIVPTVVIEFSRGTCDNELESLEREILKKMTIMVDISYSDKPKGRVQWLRSRQPDKCVVEKISMFDISMNSRKWLEGIWGRKPANESKKLKIKK